MSSNATIGNLNVKLGLDSAQFDAGIKRAQTGLGGLGKTAATVGAGVGAALAGMGVALGAAVRDTMSFADDIADTAQRLAVSTDALQEYRYAVQQLGGEAKDADAALEGFAKAFGAAHAQLSKKAAKPFERLGLDATQFKTTEDALDAVIDKISQVGSSAEQAAIADKLGLSPMLTALRAGNGEILRLRNQAHDLGVVMDASLVQRAGDANDQFEAMSKVVDVQLKSALVDLAPVLTGLIGLAGALAQALADVVDSFRDIEDKTVRGMERRRHALVVRQGQLMKGGLEPAERELFHRNAEELRSLQAELARRAATAAAAAKPKRDLNLPPVPGGGGGSGASEAARAAKAAAEDAKRDQEKALADYRAFREDQATEYEKEVQALGERNRRLADLHDQGMISTAQFNLDLANSTTQFVAATTRLKDASIPGDLTQPWTEIGAAIEQTAREADDAADDVLRGFGHLFEGISRHDWGGVLDGLAGALQRLVDFTGAAGSGFARMAATIGAAGKGAFLGQSLGLGTGKGGLDLGLALGGSALGGAAASAFGLAGSGVLTAGIANVAGSLGLGAAAASGLGAALSSAAFLGPIAAVLALGLGSLLKAKPSNKGAGFDLITGQFSGKSRDADTEQAAKAAGDAILAGEKQLRDAGIQLGTTINGLVIGTRDLSQIYTSTGATITAAIGDPAAAAEAALKAVLEGATYVSDAQETLVRGMLAAGKGFDDVTAALEGYRQAQSLGGSIADAIQAIVDPKGAAVTQLERAQKARADQVKAALDAGYLTADQLAELNVQLERLNSLELDKTLEQFVGSASDAIEAARNDLRDAYEAEADVLSASAERFGALAESLGRFRQSLYSGPVASLSPEERYRAAKAEFDRVSALAGGGDAKALDDLQGVSEQYLAASKDYYASSKGYFDDLDKVRAAVVQAEAYAQSQTDLQRQALEQLKAQVDGLLEVNKSVLSVRDAIAALAAAGGAPQTTPAAANDAGGLGSSILDQLNARGVAYLQNNGLTAWAQDQVAAGKFGSLGEAGQYHWANKGELMGLAFATGGLAKVGGMGGIDSQLASLRLSPAEWVSVSHVDPVAANQAAFANVGSALMRQSRAQHVEQLAVLERMGGQLAATSRAIRAARN